MYFKHEKISDILKPPTARAAYSDRTAWLMAELSLLAYIKFEGSDEDMNMLSKELVDVRDEIKIRSKIRQFIEKNEQRDSNGMKHLKDGLSPMGFELIETFSIEGTQAFVAKRESDKILALVFRGTEKTDKRDIISDLDARFFKDVNGKKTHAGFYRAYKLVEARIKKCIEKYPEYSLYISGHSLGGALAIIATKEINTKNIAACYTYGSPKVGKIEFGDQIKPPIYRVVHMYDLVPSLPPVWLAYGLFGVFRVLEGGAPMWIKPLFKKIKEFFFEMMGYAHHGDMRFLTGRSNDSSSIRLIANYNEFFRMCGRWVKGEGFKSGASDHLMEQYCEKLGIYATKRLDES